jgi:hypothetical protein
MARFCIQVSDIIETFFSIATEAGDIPESTTLFRALQQYDQVELSQDVISLFPKRVRVPHGIQPRKTGRGPSIEDVTQDSRMAVSPASRKVKPFRRCEGSGLPRVFARN